MIISCPNCQTGFVLPDQSLGASGRKVKCSKCKHIWHAFFEQPTKQPIQTQSILQTTSSNTEHLPVVQEEAIGIKKFLLMITLLVINFVIASIVFPYPKYSHAVNKLLAQKLNLPNNSGFSVVVNEVVRKEKSILVEYTIMQINPLKQESQIPLIRIRLLDKNKKILKTHILTPTIESSVNNNVTVQTEFQESPQEASYAEISIGNKLEFLSR